MWQFATNNPLTFLIVVWIAAWAASSPFRYAFRAYNRRLRAQNIAAHGWPTAPVDADGDVIYPDKED